MFHNQTISTKRPYRAAQPVPAIFHPELTKIHCPLSQDPELLATTFFFTKFALASRKSDASRGFLQVLPFLYAGSNLHSALSSATLAISFLVFGKNPNGKPYRLKARSKYNEALFRLKKALQDPEDVMKDETLVTVMLMSLLEVNESTARWHQRGCRQMQSQNRRLQAGIG